MSNTYGSNSDFPGVTVQTSGNVSVPDGKLGISLWGHSIILDGDSGIECQTCGKEEEIPDLLSMSSPFREVVYKMYILGKFREDSCSPDPEDIEKMTKDKGRTNWPDKARHRVDTNRIHWSKTTTTNGHNSGSGDTVDRYIPQGQRMVMGGTEYIYHGDGTWRDTDRNIALGTVDLIEKHGKEAKKKLPPKVVHEKQKMLDNRKKMLAQNGSIDTVSASDLQDAGVDPATTQSVDMDRGPDVDADKSISEKFAEKLLEGRNQFIR